MSHWGIMMARGQNKGDNESLNMCSVRIWGGGSHGEYRDSGWGSFKFKMSVAAWMSYCVSCGFQMKQSLKHAHASMISDLWLIPFNSGFWIAW